MEERKSPVETLLKVKDIKRIKKKHKFYYIYDLFSIVRINIYVDSLRKQFLLYF